MLIIFDLDDTLIETSNGITPWKLEKVLGFIQKEGLEVKDFDEALQTLLRLNSNVDNTLEAIGEFLELYDGKGKFYEKAVNFFYEDFPADMPVNLYEGALEVVNALGREHHLAIVTAGRKEYQKFKIEKAGIDSSLFCTINICEGKDKKPYYMSIRDALSVPASHICVCGDRVEKDLVPAKELGFKTIHVRQGRGEKSHNLHQYVDYKIEKIGQLPDVIDHLKETFENL